MAQLLVFFSRPRMGLVVYLGQMLEIKVCIDLSRGDIGVPQKFLHATQVVARFEQVGGERMPEQMWIDVGVDALSTRPVTDTGLHRARADASAAVADEQRLLVRSGHCGRDLCHLRALRALCGRPG